MRLWHELMIPYIDKSRLLSQHRECCALRGNGWDRKHSTVDYVFNHNPMKLYLYHLTVIQELRRRYVFVDELWLNPFYRGKSCDNWRVGDLRLVKGVKPIYSEHTEEYWNECISNLTDKGVEWKKGKTYEMIKIIEIE